MKNQEAQETKIQEIQEMNVLEMKTVVQIEKVVNFTPLKLKRSHGFRWLFIFILFY